MLRRLLRGVAWKVAPGPIAGRHRRYEQRLRERLGLPDAALAWAAERGDRVEQGPLAGLRYPAELLERADAPLAKIQGTYEEPLHEALAAAIAALRARPASLFVDAGCADGYYAAGVGLAAGCRVEAFDLARNARAATRALAQINGVTVRTRGGVTERALLRLASRTAVLLCDIEGAETAVLGPLVASALADAVVIVELHGDAARATVPGRFVDTHELRLIDADAAAVEELRTEPIAWLVALPQHQPARGSAARA